MYIRENGNLLFALFLFFVHIYMSELQLFGPVDEKNECRPKQFLSSVFYYSLSRREQSSKNKLLACLLICPHSTDWSKQQYENKTKYFLKNLSEANRR